MLRRVLRGDAAAIGLFPNTVPAFLISLIPLLLLPLMLGLATVFSGKVTRGLTDILAAICALLVPALVSHALARQWGQEARWLRFIIGFNWCQLALSVLGIVMLMVLGIVGEGPGSSNGIVAILVLVSLGVMGYGLWLPWFGARHGLGGSGPRAVLLVAAIYAGTLAVLMTRGMLSMEHG